MTLTTITEDDTSNGGNTIAQIIASAGGDRITDVDSGAVEGIAITSISGTMELGSTTLAQVGQTSGQFPRTARSF